MSSMIDKVLREAVNAGAVPSVAAIAADRNGVIYEGGAGSTVAGRGDPIGVDTHFRIMSMTKMLTTVAALQQKEMGNVDFDAPVADYRPEFADLQVLEGFDGDTPRLRRPASQATVKQLVTHTAGLSYWFWNADIMRWEAVTGTPNVLAGVNAIFTAPLVADPGTKFEYGINADWLGRVIEAASGVTLDVAVKEGITGPLGMDETTFLRSSNQAANTTPLHLKGADGNWAPSEINLVEEPEYWSGGHGLYSTPRDFIKFQRALLGGGELDGVRILTQTTVDAAFTNQIGVLNFPAEIPTADPASAHTFAAGPGYKWGYGLLFNTTDIPGMRRAYSGGWAGLFNSHFWVDPAAGVCGSIYSNFPPFGPPEAIELYANFERAVYASR